MDSDNDSDTKRGISPIIERSFGGNFYLQRMRVSDVPERLPYFKSLCSGKRVLHVGCTDYPVFDPNRNLHIQLKDICKQLDGLDTDLNGMAILREYVQGNYFSKPHDITGTYDVLLVPETIEHVANIQVFLREFDMIRWERIVISAPCLLGWNACFNYESHAGWRQSHLTQKEDYIEEVHPDHKAWFTPYTLSNCIEQFTSWRIERVMFLESKRMTAVQCLR